MRGLVLTFGVATLGLAGVLWGVSDGFLAALAADFWARLLTFSSSCRVALFNCLFLDSRVRKRSALPPDPGRSMLEARADGLFRAEAGPDPGRPGPDFLASSSVSSIGSG